MASQGQPDPLWEMLGTPALKQGAVRQGDPAISGVSPPRTKQTLQVEFRRAAFHSGLQTVDKVIIRDSYPAVPEPDASSHAGQENRVSVPV